ncbi:MAG: hypothetical protein E7597_06455 [Ruminococcaceae bacterium]|nr:hypothetical protein [Oscillospiraceae bacterium]
MKKYQYTSPYSEDTFRFELQAILGSSLDGCFFNGDVDKNAFEIERNYIFGSKGIPRIVLKGKFYESSGITRIVVTPKYSAVQKTSQYILALLFFALGLFCFVAGRHTDLRFAFVFCLCIWAIGILMMVLYHLLIVVCARFAIRKLKKALSIDIFEA